jgi:hypothetical protein
MLFTFKGIVKVNEDILKEDFEFNTIKAMSKEQAINFANTRIIKEYNVYNAYLIGKLIIKYDSTYIEEYDVYRDEFTLLNDDIEKLIKDKYTKTTKNKVIVNENNEIMSLEQFKDYYIRNKMFTDYYTDYYDY